MSISSLGEFKLRSAPYQGVKVTPHVQREWGNYSPFQTLTTFSNICSRTSRRFCRLALPLNAPETLPSLSKSRISIFNAHLILFVRRMTSHNSIGKYRHLVN